MEPSRWRGLFLTDLRLDFTEFHQAMNAVNPQWIRGIHACRCMFFESPRHRLTRARTA